MAFSPTVRPFHPLHRALVLGTVLLALAVESARADLLEPTTPLPVGRAFHGCAVLGDYLYVVGGTDEQTERSRGTLTVLKAPVAPDGQLGGWSATTPLPGERLYIANSTLALDDTLYILGGSTRTLNGNRLNTVLFTRPRPDGELDPWRESAPFPGRGTSTPAAISTPGFLHLIGGEQGGTNGVSSLVWSVPVLADGSLGAWEAGPEMLYPLWFHNAAAVAGRVIVWGGLQVDSNAEPSTKVLVAPILSSGRLAGWTEVWPSLPVGIYSAAHASVGPYLFSLFPRYANGDLSNDIVWTCVTPRGLQPWQRQPTSSNIRLYHPAAIDYRRGVIFLVGGRPARTSDFNKEAYVLRLSEEARREAEQGWSTRSTPSAAPAIGATASAAASLAAVAVEPRATTLSYEADALVSANALPGFVSHGAVMELARRGSKSPTLLYFTSKGAPQCESQNDKLRAGDLAALTRRANCAWIDVGDSPQAAQQRGVYRVPTWIAFDSAQLERNRTSGVMEVPELMKLLDELP